MATGETGFADVTSDPISVQHHSVRAGPDGGRDGREATVQALNGVASAPCGEGPGAPNWSPREPKLLGERTGVGMITYRQRSGALGVAHY